MPAKLLGLYEEQIQKAIFKINIKRDIKYIVNFGASDGYHIIGLVKKKIFQLGLAFEKSSKIRNILNKNINKNNLSKKIKIFKQASFQNLSEFIEYKNLKKTFFLVDIEGDEFKLFNKKNLKWFKNSFLIIEMHEKIFNKKNKLIKNFYNLMNKYFIIEKIYSEAKNPFAIKQIEKFDEDLKWLCMSECRPFNQVWIICKPRFKN